jgi:hypothetical protein
MLSYGVKQVKLAICIGTKFSLKKMTSIVIVISDQGRRGRFISPLSEVEFSARRVRAEITE